MMTGTVNADLEPLLRLTVRDAGGQPRDVEAVIGTGFNGFLTLPPPLIAAQGLPWLCRQLEWKAGHPVPRPRMMAAHRT